MYILIKNIFRLFGKLKHNSNIKYFFFFFFFSFWHLLFSIVVDLNNLSFDQCVLKDICEYEICMQ